MGIPDRFARRQYGFDTSGRKLFLFNDTKSRLDEIKDDLGWLPTITQAEDMDNAGGGAADSAGYHDGRGCVDFRTWDRTDSDLDDFIRASSKYAVQGWRRDAAHGGMDPHCHVVCLGPTQGMSSGAISQIASVKRGGDGLVPEGHDYELDDRKKPLVTNYNYAKFEREEDEMQPEDFERIEKIINRAATQPLLKRLNLLGENTRETLGNLGKELDGIGNDIDRLPAEQREAIRSTIGPRLRSIREAVNALATQEEE